MIPFHIPPRAKNQEQYVLASLAGGALQGDGPFSRRAAARLAQITGVPRVLLTPSASHALELGFFALAPGDEVILPAYNFPSVPNAVLRGGGRPVLCDVDPFTQNIDPEDAARRVTPRTRAISVTHYAGIACDMAAIQAIAKANGLMVVEDAAQGLGAAYGGAPLGSLGDWAAVSFHSTKNITAGEGGAYLHNGDDEAFDLASMRREKGTNRHTFQPKTEQFYYWETTGASLLLSEPSAALLLAQLEELDRVTARRREILARYDAGLAPLFQSGRLMRMGVPRKAVGNGHIYYFLAQNGADQQYIRAGMAAAGVPALPHFAPLHAGKMGAVLGYRMGDFPNSERTAERLLRLPVYDSLPDETVDEIVDALTRTVNR